MRQVLYETIACLGQYASPETMARLGNGLGEVFWRTLRSRRKMAREAIAFHLDKSLDEAEALARQSFTNSARAFLEILLSRRVDHRFLKERVTLDRPEIWETIVTSSRPVVITSGHLGAWEVMLSLATALCRGREFLAVARRPKDQAMHELITHLRRKNGMHVVSHRNATRPVLKTLRQNGMVAFLVDHNCSRDEAVFLPFLGLTAAVNKGPAMLAVRAGALVCPVFLVRNNGRYVMHLDECLDTGELEGDPAHKVRTAAEFYTRAVENMVRRYPEQWYWLHKRWKTRPPDDAPVY